MIKEYQFAALIYDEDAKVIRCAACGREIPERKCIYRSGGRWVCGKCIPGFAEIPLEVTLCSTAKAAVEK